MTITSLDIFLQLRPHLEAGMSPAERVCILNAAVYYELWDQEMKEATDKLAANLSSRRWRR